MRYFFCCRLEILLLVIALWLIPSVLRGQGWERIVPIQDESSTSNIILELLPLADNSLVYRTTSSIGHLAQNGDLRWSVPSSTTVKIAQEDNHIWFLERVGFQQEVSLRERLFSVDGEVLRDTAYQLIDFSGTGRQGASRRLAVLEPNGELTYFMNSQPVDTELGTSAGDSIHCFRLAADRSLVQHLRFGVGEFSWVEEAFSLPDASYALLVASDTVYDGATVANVQPVVPVHLRLDGSLTLLDTFFPVPLHDARLFPTGDFNLSLAYQSGDIRLKDYDFTIDAPIGERSIPLVAGDNFSLQSVLPLRDGDMVIVGKGRDFSSGSLIRNLYQLRLDADLNRVYRQYHGLPNVNVNPVADPVELPNGFLAIAGHPSISDEIGELIVNVTPEGDSFDHLLYGTLRGGDDNCQPLPEGPGLGGWWLRIEPTTPRRDTLFAFTTPSGYFEVRTDTGAYLLRTISPNAYWDACPPVTVTPLEEADSSEVNLVVRPLTDCPLVSVGIAAPSTYRRCDPTNLFIDYQNRGTATANASLLRVVLDPEFTPTSGNPAWDLRSGDTLWYNLPDLPISASGTIELVGELGCETTVPFQTHCMAVNVYPDSLCVPLDPLWDGSSVSVGGQCINDTVYFEIRNEGANNMSMPSQYIITEDVVLHQGGDFQLPSGGNLQLRVPSTGATYRLVAQQVLGHPGNSQPSITVEGCGAAESTDYSIGVFGQYPQDEGDPFVAIDCRQNNGQEPDGFSGNGVERLSGPESTTSSLLLSVQPTGIGPDALIDTGQVLKYHLMFENTGELTVQSVLLTDTLANYFDLNTLTPVVASHPYQFSVSPFGAIQFAFSDLNLMPGAGGFVQFQVKLKKGLAPGTPIVNQAAITFGGRPFARSNEVTLQLRKPQRYGISNFSECRPFSADLPSFVRSLDTFSFSTHDSISLQIAHILPEYFLTIDTVLAPGDTLLGHPIFSDSTVLDFQLTQAGCDSILQYLISIDAAATVGNFLPEAAIRLFPNPANVHIGLQLPTGMVVRSLTLMDALGRTYPLEPTGTRSEYRLNGIPAGWYIVRCQTNTGRWLGRLLISKATP